MLLKAVAVSKVYNREVIFSDVSLGIDIGESLAITGTSGSGKTTLLSILGLLMEPTKGDVFFQERSVFGLTDDEKSHLRNNYYGFIFQDPQLIGSLTVLDNVMVPARLARRSNLQEKAEKLLNELGLQHRLHHLPYQLSIGQRRRVAIARALLLDPLLVLADEPTNDLDQDWTAWIGNYLFKLPHRGKALILVTHDPDLAHRADRVVQISEGRIRDLPAGSRNRSHSPGMLPPKFNPTTIDT